DEDARWPWEWSLDYALPEPDEQGRQSALSQFRGVLDHPSATTAAALGNWQIVLHPIRAVAEPAAVLFHGDAGWSELADAVTRLLWMLIVWSVFGGAIARIAAVQFARDQQIGLRAALTFALSRFFGYVSA